MSVVVTLNRDASGQPCGLDARSSLGCVSLYAYSRDTFSLMVFERGRRPIRRTLSRRGVEAIEVIAAIAGAPPSPTPSRPPGQRDSGPSAAPLQQHENP